jgi:hypothetical protein
MLNIGNPSRLSHIFATAQVPFRNVYCYDLFKLSCEMLGDAANPAAEFEAGSTSDRDVVAGAEQVNQARVLRACFIKFRRRLIIEVGDSVSVMRQDGPVRVLFPEGLPLIAQTGEEGFLLLSRDVDIDLRWLGAVAVADALKREAGGADLGRSALKFRRLKQIADQCLRRIEPADFVFDNSVVFRLSTEDSAVTRFDKFFVDHRSRSVWDEKQAADSSIRRMMARQE